MYHLIVDTMPRTRPCKKLTDALSPSIIFAIFALSAILGHKGGTYV
jgi:hypothetical protein